MTGSILKLNSHIKETNVLTKVHEHWAKNVTSRVFTCFHNIHNEKNAPPTGSHIIILRDINKTNVLTNFHDNWAKIVTSRVFKRKTDPPPPGSHVIQLTGTIFELNSHIKETNVLTKFHENWAKNVTSRVFTCFHYIHNEKNAPPTGGHVFHRSGPFSNSVLTSHVIQLTGTIFELKSHIKETYVLTKFHENWAKNVTSRVFTCFHYYTYREKCPAHWRPYFSPIWTISKLVRNINKTNALTNFHDDWAKIVTSRLFTRKTAPPPPGSHVIQLTGTIFELNSHIKETNVLTKFHENWVKNVNLECSHKNAPPTGGHVFSPIWTIFELVRDIKKKQLLTSHVIQLTGTIFELNSHIKETYVLTKFHENWAKNVTSRKNAPPTCGHIFSPIWTIFELVRNINKTNVLTNFHDDWAKIVTSRVFTRKTAPPPGSHVIQLTETIFELNSHIKETNVLTKFYEHWAKNVTSRVFTCFHYKHNEKNVPPTGGHVFSPIWTIFELVRDIKKNNVLTNFHDDWAEIVTSRLFTRKPDPPPPGSHETNVLTTFYENWAENVTYRKNAPPTGGHNSSEISIKPIHVIQLTGTIFELNSHIKETNVLTKVHEIWAKNVTSRLFTCFHNIHIEKNDPPTGGHVFSPIWTIFELVRDINKINVLTNFHDDWAKIVTSRVLTRFLYPGSHVIQLTGTIFELKSQIKETNVLTKFHENWAKNVTSRVFTCFHYIHIEKNAPPTGSHVF
ncbi:hypothetical protein DPMN_006672 [Dreissena polymorpha]|uniref:Uncharacterized protein n=1 Tax=Dreissena polymorpha TaxID=45954 RepID=A0A9D4MUN1_DREPO|nr:hypothetical protein DPMN_006672 [Dreissena polymorpha]